MLSLAAKRAIGLAAIVGGILIIFLGVTKPNPFADTRSVWAEFESAQGLGAIGRDVRLAGVNVGIIGEVKREGDNALIELVLNKDFPVHVDARAEMRPHTLFEGSSFIDLSPGSPSAPLLEDGEAIPVAQTDNYVTLDEALRVLRPEIRESLQDLAKAGSKTLKGGAVEGIQRTLKAGPKLTRNLKAPVRALQGSSRSELAGALRGMASTVDAVAEREDQLIPLAQRLNRTAAAVTVDDGAALDATLVALPGALQELRDGAPALTGLVDRLDRLAVAINPSLPALTTAVNRSTPLLESSIPVLERATPLIAGLRTIGRRVTAAVPTLGDLIVSLDPVVTIFGGSVLPALLAPSRQGQPTYQQVSALFTAADGVFSPYQTEAQNPNGAGHLWSQGIYIDPLSELGPILGGGAATEAGAASGSDTPCSTVAQISPDAAAQIEAMGACK